MAQTGKGFLEEEPGDKSAMRAMSMIALLASVVFGALVLTAEASTTADVYVVFGFLISAFAPKALQKFAEGPLTSLDTPGQ
jgi:hypothetical protein